MPTVFCRDCEKMTYYRHESTAEVAADIHRVKTNGHRPWIGSSRPRELPAADDEAPSPPSRAATDD